MWNPAVTEILCQPSGGVCRIQINQCVLVKDAVVQHTTHICDWSSVIHSQELLGSLGARIQARKGQGDRINPKISKKRKTQKPLESNIYWCFLEILYNSERAEKRTTSEDLGICDPWHVSIECRQRVAQILDWASLGLFWWMLSRNDLASRNRTKAAMGIKFRERQDTHSKDQNGKILRPWLSLPNPPNTFWEVAWTKERPSQEVLKGSFDTDPHKVLRRLGYIK